MSAFSRRGGYGLLELLIASSIFFLILELTFVFFGATWRRTAQLDAVADSYQNYHEALEVLLRHLRSSSPDGLRFEKGELRVRAVIPELSSERSLRGQAVVYRCNSGGLEREEGQLRRRWPHFAHLQVHIEGSRARIALDSSLLGADGNRRVEHIEQVVVYGL